MKQHASRPLNRQRGVTALFVTALFAAASLAGAQAPPPAPPAPPAPPGAAPAPPAPALSNDQASYLFGLTFGEQLHTVGINEVDAAAVTRGMKDALNGKKATQADRLQVQQYAHSMMLALQARNKSASDEFLAHNGHEKGVKTTASGLQYKVLAPGDAKAPAIAATDQVTVNYRGKLIDGTEFDSSYTRGTPASFPVNGVIKGWQEALVLMKPGAKWELYVPPELGYGANPRPGIPANSLLIFDVELLSAQAGGGAPPPGPAARKMTPPAAPPAATPRPSVPPTTQ